MLSAWPASSSAAEASQRAGGMLERLSGATRAWPGQPGEDAGALASCKPAAAIEC